MWLFGNKKKDKFQRRFNSKSTWKLIHEEKPIKMWWMGMWFKYTTPKYAFHAWVAVLNRLCTGDKMAKWNVGVTGTCISCLNKLETQNHLYFECSFSEEIWRTLTHKLLGHKYTSNWDSLVELLVDDSQDKTIQFLTRYVFQATLHTIWKERNNRRHGKTPKTAKQLIKLIDKQVRNRLSTIWSMGDCRFESGMEAWFASRQTPIQNVINNHYQNSD